ncbi:MAG: VOC family protein [Rhodospirillales bacterium]|nr:MAG: VOC family protein [Rhodospirillales bacterium]
MSRLFGDIRQLGYVVRDIDAALRHWTDVLGVGPWFYVERLPVVDFRYKGAPSDVAMSVALANSGDVQIELIQQRNDAPSMYRDFLADGQEGLQHVSTWPEDYDGVVAAALAAGHRIGQSGATARGPFAYFETGILPGTVMEIAELTPTRARQFAAIAAAARGWDGSDPVRTVWPQ